MEKIIIQTIDCGRHDYWKVDLELISDLNIIEQDPSWLGSNWKLLLGGTAALFIVILFGVGIAKST